MKEIIVALDVGSSSEAFHLVGKLEDEITWYKVGSVLFTKEGPAIIEGLKKLNKKVMLDLKYHDIPNTVNKACYQAAELGADMLTVHLSGGLAMLKAAVDGVESGSLQRGDKCWVLGISVLTSINDEVLSEELNIDKSVVQYVDSLVALAAQADIDGIVCSAKETAGLRETCPKIKIINPGIRMSGGDKSDQKRVTTPKEAFDAGADFIVMGRQVYQNENPAGFIKKVKESL